MKYDRNTMKSLQEAYESVSEDKFYSGKDRDPNTGLPKGLKPEKVKKVKTKKAKKPNYGSSTMGNDQKDMKVGYKEPKITKPKPLPEEKVSKDHPNHPDRHEDHPDMSYKDAARIRVEKKTAKKQVESGNRSRLTDKYYPEKKGLKYPVGNKIVPTKKRVDEAIKMSKKDYAKTHKDFKSDDKKNPRVTRYVPGKGTVSTPVELTDEVNKENCGCGETPCKTYGQKKAMDDKMKEVEDMRSLPTRMNLIKTKLRAMGLNMSHELKGKELSEVIDYTLVERTRYQKEKGIGKGGTKKPNFPKVSDPALDAVKAKYKGQIMTGHSRQPKKVPGEKTGGGGKYKAMADQKKQTAADAKKRGFDNVQNYVDTMARYGGKKNYDSGKGLGS